MEMVIRNGARETYNLKGVFIMDRNAIRNLGKCSDCRYVFDMGGIGGALENLGNMVKALGFMFYGMSLISRAENENEDTIMSGFVHQWYLVEAQMKSSLDEIETAIKCMQKQGTGCFKPDWGGTEEGFIPHEGCLLEMEGE
jgi:hypothetical protein